jgi:hypothetical protein
MINVTAKVVDGVVKYYDASGTEITLAEARSAVSNEETVVNETNRRLLLSRATAALASNDTYLGRTSPTSAQNTAQIRSLTRQMNALIRLTTRALDTSAGT